MEQDKIWDSQSEQWDKMAEDTENYYTRRSGYIVDLVLRNLKNRSIDRLKILEGGCGAGLMSQLLSNRGFDVYGYDVSPKMIMITRRRVFGDPDESSEHFRVCMGEEVPFDSMKFDLFVGMDLFPYIRDYDSYIRKLSKFLKSNGLVVASCNNRCSLFNFRSILKHIFMIDAVRVRVIGKVANWRRGRGPSAGKDRKMTLRSSVRDWRSILMNLIRTAYWSGGYIDFKMARQVYDANSFDELFSRNGFKKIDELGLFALPLLDRNPLNRGYLARVIAKYFGWNYIGVYQKIA